MRVSAKEPSQFAAGRDFEFKVKQDFKSREDVDTEYQLLEATGRRGRADIWVTFDRSSDGSPVATAIFEIKSTNWDLCTFERLRPNILRMARQLWRYVDTALDVEHQTAQAYLVFPSIPADIYVQRVIELLLAERGILTLWWAQQLTTPYEFMDAATEGGVDMLTLLDRLAADFLSVDGVIPAAPPWLSRAFAAGRNTRAGMGKILWENL